MLIDAKRIIALLSIATLSVWVGMLIAWSMPMAQVARENLLLKYPERTIGELNRGLSTLANCPYVRKMYPALPERIYRMGDVYFAYDPLNPLLQEAYAGTNTASRTITLMDHFFAEPQRMRESILAHETLHILLGYKHKLPLNEAKDAIYITITQCFGPDY